MTGVQNYDGKRRLKNTLNDANAVARIFSDIGFDTHKLTDETAAGGKVSYNEMQRAVSDFVKEIDENTVDLLSLQRHHFDRRHLLSLEHRVERRNLERLALFQSSERKRRKETVPKL